MSPLVGKDPRHVGSLIPALLGDTEGHGGTDPTAVSAPQPHPHCLNPLWTHLSHPCGLQAVPRLRPSHG